MTSERPYRRAMNKKTALNEIERGEGTQFDPRVVDTFLKSTDEGVTLVLGIGGLNKRAPLNCRI